MAPTQCKHHWHSTHLTEGGRNLVQTCCHCGAARIVPQFVRDSPAPCGPHAPEVQPAPVTKPRNLSWWLGATAAVILLVGAVLAAGCVGWIVVRLLLKAVRAV